MEKDPEAEARVWAVVVRAAGARGAGVARVWAAAKEVGVAGWAVRWRPVRAGIVYAPNAGNRLVMLSGSRVIR